MSCEKDFQNEDLEKIESSNTNEFHSFDSADDFYSYLKATPIERRTFLDQLNFTTYSQYLDNLLDEIDKNSTEEEISNFVDKYHDLFTIEVNSDGVKSVESKTRVNSLLIRVANSNGVFVVGNNAYKTFNNYLVETKLDLIYNLSTIHSTEIAGLDKNLFSAYAEKFLHCN